MHFILLSYFQIWIQPKIKYNLLPLPDYHLNSVTWAREGGVTYKIKGFVCLWHVHNKIWLANRNKTHNGTQNDVGCNDNLYGGCMMTSHTSH